MPSRPHPYRILAIGLGLLACTAAWLAAIADGPAPTSSSQTGKATAPGASTSREPSPQRERNTALPSLSPTEEAIISEILQIRREQGGLLDGTLLEELSGAASQPPGPATTAAGAPDDEFVQALRGVAAASSAQLTPSPPSFPEHRPDPIDSSRESAGERLARPSDDEDLIPLLRLAARRLDWRSADFEDAEAYRPAQRCRSVANQLRRLARDLRQLPEPAMPRRPPEPQPSGDQSE